MSIVYSPAERPGDISPSERPSHISPSSQSTPPERGLRLTHRTPSFPELQNPRLLPLLSRNPHAPTPLHLRHALCSSSSPPTPSPTIEPTPTVDTPEEEAPSAAAAEEKPDSPPPRAEEPLHETILRMIRRRKWTTRLENSVRLLSPTLSAPLVHGVISSAAAANHADLALQFFRFAYRRAGFRPEPATFSLLIPILASNRMLNHARCILLETMPAFSVSPDEAHLARECLQWDPEARPSMTEVVQILSTIAPVAGNGKHRRPHLPDNGNNFVDNGGERRPQECSASFNDRRWQDAGNDGYGRDGDDHDHQAYRGNVGSAPIKTTMTMSRSWEEEVDLTEPRLEKFTQPTTATSHQLFR